MADSISNDQATTPAVTANIQDPKLRKPYIFGIYGLPGSGKSTLLNKLHLTLGEEQFAFYNGPDMLEKLVPGSLNAFKTLPEDEKNKWRDGAIDDIGKECKQESKTGIAAGHYLFWDKEDDNQGEIAHHLPLNISACAQQPTKGGYQARTSRSIHQTPAQVATRRERWLASRLLQE